MVRAAPGLSLQEVQCLEGHSDRVWGVAWASAGDALASCSGDKTVRVWAREAGPGTRWVCKAILEESHHRTVRSCEWSPDGRFLATASFDATTAIWEHTGGEFECVASLEGHENEVKSVAWNAGGTLLATCSRDKSVWIWEAQPGNEYECVSVLQGHSQDVKMVRWHPTRDLLVSASYDDTIKVWAEDGDEDDWRCVQTLTFAAQGHTSTVWGVAFNSTGDRMVSCSDDLTLKVWDTHTDPTTSVGAGAGAWKHVSTISGYHERTIFSVDWSRVNGLIASASGDDAIRIFAEDEEPPSTVGQPTFSQVAKKEKAHSTDVNCVRWHPKDPKLLASASDDMCVKIWELRGQSESSPHGGSANGSKDEHL